MDASALIGKVLGSCLLQEVIGSGTMGIVYRAAQSQPFRQVAVKVMTRAASLDIEHQIEFLEQFRGAIAQAARLEHPHIVPLYEYDDTDGLAYVVMADIQGETLEELLARRGALELPLALRYLEQIAESLDYAHAHGVIHRDLKPANVFITPDEQVLVADFNITSVLVEGTIAAMRLSRPGMLDYMSPELVVGKAIDRRADIYSLGAMLFRMVTGAPVFQGQTLLKIATKHLKMPPPSPRALRRDLPVAAEAAILKALEKNPANRYEYAGDLALFFRRAIQDSAHPVHPVHQPEVSPVPSPATPEPRLSQVDSPTISPETSPEPLYPRQFQAPYSSWPAHLPAASTALGREQTPGSTGAFAFSESVYSDRYPQFSAVATNDRTTPGESGGAAVSPENTQLQLVDTTGTINRVATNDPAGVEERAGQKLAPLALVAAQENTGTTGTLKLTSPARLVSIPVAGQPGQFVTGILPRQSLRNTDEATPALAQGKQSRQGRKKVMALALVALLVLLGSAGFWLARTTQHHSPAQVRTGQTTIARTPDLEATATEQAEATLEANTILFDPLSQNIRNWPVLTGGTLLYQFKDGAYHITNNDPSRIAPAILPGVSLNQPFAYTLTMQEERGDDTSINNEFGLIVRFTSHQVSGKTVVSFYSFEVLNNKSGQYQFWKYDNSSGASNPWKELAQHPFGSEFHQGQGKQNAFTILANGKNFTLIVNGKQVWSVSDGSLTSGGVGMLVNLKGTEVAFSNLRLTRD